MRINDKDVKTMIAKVNDIHVKLERMEQKLTDLCKTSNGQAKELSEHNAAISDLRVSLAGLKVKVWFLFVIGCTVGGALGSAITKIVIA